jgi:hypothetical protein
MAISRNNKPFSASRTLFRLSASLAPLFCHSITLL